MTKIVLFPSVLGLRPAIQQAAARFEAAGHIVHVIDLYGNGQVFDTYSAAFAHLDEIGGFRELVARTQIAAAELPADVVYTGFSTGGASAELLTLTRPGARAALLFHSSTKVKQFGVDSWPAGVPVQVHYAHQDPFRDQGEVDALAAAVRAADASYEFYEYAISGHLFTDPGLPEEYDEKSSELLYERALGFLDDLVAP